MTETLSSVPGGKDAEAFRRGEVKFTDWIQFVEQRFSSMCFQPLFHIPMVTCSFIFDVVNGPVGVRTTFSPDLEECTIPGAILGTGAHEYTPKCHCLWREDPAGRPLHPPRSWWSPVPSPPAWTSGVLLCQEFLSFTLSLPHSRLLASQTNYLHFHPCLRPWFQGNSQ